MHKNLLTILMSILLTGAIAQIPSGYYDDAQGLSGESLKTALHGIIDGHDTQSYGSLWIHFESTDPKPNGKVWDMYSDVPGGTPPYEYNFGDDQCGNYGGEGDCYNREHSFPKSWFNDSSPMNSDLFHLVPTDGYVNGRRSNWPFGEVGSASWTSENGCKVGSNNTSGYSGTVFEPIDEYKGDFARIYFYMATRYEDRIAGWEGNSDNSDAALDGTSFPCYEEWYLNMILDWHQNDPVSQKEIDRNNEIYDIQDNRNPYVDHPEYVNAVWGGVMAPSIGNVNWTPNTPDAGVAVNVTATITDDGTVTSAQLKYGFSSSNLNQTVNMTNSGTTYSAEIPGQTAGQEVYFRIVATDDESNNSQSAVYDYQVAQEAGMIALPFLEDFNDETLGIFIQYSVSGAEQYWHNDDYNDAYYAKMSNYNGDENIENEDWMITPAINFDNYTNEKLQFNNSMKDYSDNSTHIYLKYSTNYSGTGNPNNASWTDITSSANWSNGDYEWVESGEISLASITGTQVYVAFIYESQAGSGKTWQLDDISITIDGTSNNPPQISNVDHTPTIPAINEAVTVSATITDDNVVSSAQVLWGLSSSSLNETIDMSASGSTYSAEIPGQAEGVQVFYKVKATDNDGATAESSVENYTVASSANLPPEINDVTYNPTTPDENEAVTVEAVITDDEGVESALVAWGMNATSLNNIVEMSNSGDDYSAEIPGQNQGLTVYFKVQAFDEDSEMTETSVYNYTVATTGNVQTLPFSEDFETEDLGIFNEYSVSGDEQTWHNDDYEDNLYAKMSNYNGTENLANEDWLMTDPINFNNYSNEVMRFRSSMKDYSDNSTFIYLKYSTNYTVGSDPNSATWVDLSTQASWSNGDYEWVESGDIDLSGITGTEVFLAFQYVSQDGSGKTWQLDDISVTLEATNEPPVISNVNQNPEEPNNTDIVEVSAQITDDGNIDLAELQWGTSPAQLTNIVDMSASSGNFTASIPAQAAGLTIYYRIMAKDNEEAVSYSSVYNYLVDLAEGVGQVSQATRQLYPNPTANVISISGTNNEQLQLNILHSSGKLIKTISNYITNTQLNISDLAPGVYFIQVLDKDNTQTLSVIKH